MSCSFLFRGVFCDDCDFGWIGYSTSMLVSCLSSELKGLIFGAKMPNGTMNAGKNQMG